MELLDEAKEIPPYKIILYSYQRKTYRVVSSCLLRYCGYFNSASEFGKVEDIDTNADPEILELFVQWIEKFSLYDNLGSESNTSYESDIYNKLDERGYWHLCKKEEKLQWLEKVPERLLFSQESCDKEGINSLVELAIFLDYSMLWEIICEYKSNLLLEYIPSDMRKRFLR